MGSIDIDGRVVEYDLAGDGQPVVFVHARPFVCWYVPLLARLGGWRTIVVRRSATGAPATSIESDARHCASLLGHVGIERPHVVGHSYGGLVALELARQRVVEPRSLALLEPAAAGLLDPAEAATRYAPMLELARTAGPAVAMEGFLDAVCGVSGHALLDALVPGGVTEAKDHAGGFFDAELPAVIRWAYGAADAAAIDVPVLNVVGGASAPRFAAAAALLHDWLPGAPPVTIDGATHLLMAQAPDETAQHLQRFWRRR